MVDAICAKKLVVVALVAKKFVEVLFVVDAFCAKKFVVDAFTKRELVAKKFVAVAFTNNEVLAVSDLIYASVSVAPTAERLVVDALASVAVPVAVRLPKSAFIAERFVADALVINACVIVVVASVVVPTNDLLPANVCVVVETRPRDEGPASGMLNVCVLPREEMLKSVPAVPVTKNWDIALRPLISVMPEPGAPAPASTKITSPVALTESALPFAVLVGELAVNCEKRSPETLAKPEFISSFAPGVAVPNPTLLVDAS